MTPCGHSLAFMAGDAPKINDAWCVPGVAVLHYRLVYCLTMPDKDAHLRWKEVFRRQIASCPIFDLYAAERVSSAGQKGEFWILDARDWVNVVPVLLPAEGEPRFLMVRQYRHGADLITTEFPAGLVERGEDPAAAAGRELAEETGYRAGRLTLIGELRPNPAFMTNHCYTYLAEDLQPTGGAALDDLEALESLSIPMAEVEERAGRGELVNALTLVALMSYQRHRAAHP
jgi:ADP-ribose pyrophosphatase